MEVMSAKERSGTHIRNMTYQVMASNLILKMDRLGLKHINEGHPLTFREWDEDKSELGS